MGVLTKLEESGALSWASPAVQRFIKMFFFALLLWHWLGCLWVYIWYEQQPGGMLHTEDALDRTPRPETPTPDESSRALMPIKLC